uniref:Uncharacterized protein C12G12.07c n=1 Tax=Anthurium amnicola TaxID=1678845 RepID=A0A1D1XLB3_9ARAE
MAAAATSVSSEAAAAAEAADGPVLSMMSKRLRALRKKYNRILQMEESLAQGKSLNKEQEEVLRSKPAVATLIEEYEKLRQPLSAALQEELSLAPLSSAAASSPPLPPSDENEQQDLNQVQDPGDGSSDGAGSPQELQPGPDLAVEDLLNLLYFGCLFDVKPQSEFASMAFTRTHERECCLTYDYVTDDDSTAFLKEGDLDLISDFASLVISRPRHSGVSHMNALLGCVQHAKLWLCNSDQPIQSGSSITYAGLRERLNRILASDYFTTTPELKAPVDVAAAVGKYASCQVQVSNSAPDSTALPLSSVTEVAPALFQDKDNDPENFERKDTGCNPSSPVDDSLKGESDVLNDFGDSDEVQQEQYSLLEDEENQKDSYLNEQYYAERRTYQNQRGGNRGGGGGRGRRDYVNGRGARGGYQNGRSQYYDPAYYPRNYYHTRGRGSRGGGSAMNSNHVRVTRGGHTPADV